MREIYFYDTCSLLLAGEDAFNNEKFIISSITLQELEQIKQSSHKSNEIKYQARLLLRLLEEYSNNYEVVIHKLSHERAIADKQIEITNDTKILSDAIYYDNEITPDELVFITNDIALQNIANLFLGEDMIASIEQTIDEYCGYREFTLNNSDLAKFYENNRNFGLLPNEYVVLRNQEQEVIDLRWWDGTEYKYLDTTPINSKWFGKIAPYSNDIYQKMALDSLKRNQLTVLRGPAGSGKSILGLTYLFSLVESGQIDKIYIFCNPVATKDSARLGFYPGDKNAKLLDSQIGNFLITKFGDMSSVEQLIAEDKIVLVPTADCRGMNIPSNCGVYVTEAQNSTVDTMKLILQRVGENTKCVIEGDSDAQVDLSSYEGNNNGLRRLSEVFRGEDFYGEVTLKYCYRSRVASKANEM